MNARLALGFRVCLRYWLLALSIGWAIDESLHAHPHYLRFFAPRGAVIPPQATRNKLF